MKGVKELSYGLGRWVYANNSGRVEDSRSFAGFDFFWMLPVEPILVLDVSEVVGLILKLEKTVPQVWWLVYNRIWAIDSTIWCSQLFLDYEGFEGQSIFYLSLLGGTVTDRHSRNIVGINIKCKNIHVLETVNANAQLFCLGARN